MIYIAYGLDIGKDEMLAKVPQALFIKFGTLEGYELKFRGVENFCIGTLEKCVGGALQVSLWQISKDDLLILDRHKGVPSLSYRLELEFESTKVLTHALYQTLALQEPSQEVLKKLEILYKMT